jgi:protein subunit release factor A
MIDKIKEYLITLTNKCMGWVAEDVAKDIAEICEAEMLHRNMQDAEIIGEADKEIRELKKENKSLKDKLDKDGLIPKLTLFAQQPEMRQGCSNHSYYAEILAKEIIGE